MEIGNLIKKQQLNHLKKRSLYDHKIKMKAKAKKKSLFQRQRYSLGISLPQLSRLTGINQITLQRWETAGMTPNDKVPQIRKYANVMHLNFMRLIQSIMKEG